MDQLPEIYQAICTLVEQKIDQLRHLPRTQYPSETRLEEEFSEQLEILIKNVTEETLIQLPNFPDLSFLKKWGRLDKRFDMWLDLEKRRNEWRYYETQNLIDFVLAWQQADWSLYEQYRRYYTQELPARLEVLIRS